VTAVSARKLVITDVVNRQSIAFEVARQAISGEIVHVDGGFHAIGAAA